MTEFTRLRLAAGAALLAAGVTACAKPMPLQPPQPPAPAVVPTPPPAPPAAARTPDVPAEPRALTEDEIFSRKSIAELNAEKPLADVAFDYDRVEIRDDQRAVLQRNVDFLKRWTAVRVMVEGHADERGTREYNLALSERRAVAVRSYMASLGIAEERLAVTGKGEEVPLCQEVNDVCFAQNRRGQFVITAK